MIDTVLYSYLLGWVVTSIGLAFTVRKLQDPVRPPSHSTPILIAAGAAWPLVLLGALQMATVTLVARSWNSLLIHKRVRAFADNELDELLDEWLNTPERLS